MKILFYSDEIDQIESTEFYILNWILILKKYYLTSKTKRNETKNKPKRLS